MEAESNIHIALSRKDPIANSFYEIILGGSKGSRSAIRKRKPNKTLVSKAHSVEKFHQWRVSFELRVTDNSFGLYDSAGDPIVEFVGHKGMTTNFNYLHVSTGWGSTGSWTIEPTTCK